jgi:hypothetical protein
MRVANLIVRRVLGIQLKLQVFSSCHLPSQL